MNISLYHNAELFQCLDKCHLDIEFATKYLNVRHKKYSYLERQLNGVFNVEELYAVFTPYCKYMTIFLSSNLTNSTPERIIFLHTSVIRTFALKASALRGSSI